jgi:hypothetical protein
MIPVRLIPLEFMLTVFPTLVEVAVITPTFKFVGGEILVENPARLDALDIL